MISPRSLVLVATLAALVVVAMIAVGQSTVDAPPATPKPGQALAGASRVEADLAGIPQDGAVLGEAGAPLTLTEFVDLQCPFCAEWSRDALPGVLPRVRSGELKIVLRPLRFLGPDSVKAAALAGAAAEQDKLWQYVELLYLNQGRENSGWFSESFQRRLAAAVPGLDAQRALAGRSAPAALRLSDAAEHAAKAAGVESTPAFALARGDGAARMLTIDPFDRGALRAALDRAQR